jgi:hypothetical protein
MKMRQMMVVDGYGIALGARKVQPASTCCTHHHHHHVINQTNPQISPIRPNPFESIQIHSKPE